MSLPVKHNKLLVLDLDETLIYGTLNRLLRMGAPDHVVCGEYSIYLRPGVEEFLETSFDRFETVGIWTAATPDYAFEVLDKIVDRSRFEFVFTRERCTVKRDWDQDEHYSVKDIAKLKKFGYPKSQILFVDDTARGLERSYGNHVPIPAFKGDREDRILPALTEYLDQLGGEADVRTVNKLRWWTRNSV